MMKFAILCLFLIQSFAFADIENDLLQAMSQPVTQLAIATFIKSENSHLSEKQKMLQLLSLLERSITPSQNWKTDSLESYKKLRHQKLMDLNVYWSEVSNKGIPTPLNITAPNSAIYEQILEFEVNEIDQTIKILKQSNLNISELNQLLPIFEELVKVYKMGLKFRDSLDQKTKVWEGIPGLNFLRTIGENIINPAVRKVIYSEVVLNQIRNFAKKSLNNMHHKIDSDYENMKLEFKNAIFTWFDGKLEKELSSSELFKPIKNLPADQLMDLASSFLKSLSNKNQERIIWNLFNERTHLIEIFKEKSIETIHLYWHEFFRKNPELVSDFIHWLELKETIKKFKNLSNLPLHEITFSFANLIHSISNENENIFSAKLIGQSQYRNVFGFTKAKFSFFLLPTIESEEARSVKSGLTLDIYLSEHPEYENFIKDRMAQSWIHASLTEGVPLTMSEKIYVDDTNSQEPIKIYLSPLTKNSLISDSLIERPKDLVDFVAELPINALIENNNPTLETLTKTYYSEPMVIDNFLKSTRHLQWVIQMHQLRGLVGDKVFRKAFVNYLLKNPKLILSFLQKKWQYHSRNKTSSSLNACLKFYH